MDFEMLFIWNVQDDYRNGVQPNCRPNSQQALSRCPCEWCRTHQYGCHSLRMTQTGTLWHATHVWLHKKQQFAYITCLTSSCPAHHKCVIIHDEGLIGCSNRSGEHAITAPISDYLHLFGDMKMQSKFSICLVVDLQFVFHLRVWDV